MSCKLSKNLRLAIWNVLKLLQGQGSDKSHSDDTLKPQKTGLNRAWCKHGPDPDYHPNGATALLPLGQPQEVVGVCDVGSSWKLKCQCTCTNQTNQYKSGSTSNLSSAQCCAADLLDCWCAVGLLRWSIGWTCAFTWCSSIQTTCHPPCRHWPPVRHSVGNIWISRLEVCPKSSGQVAHRLLDESMPCAGPLQRTELTPRTLGANSDWATCHHAIHICLSHAMSTNVKCRLRLARLPSSC